MCSNVVSPYFLIKRKVFPYQEIVLRTNISKSSFLRVFVKGKSSKSERNSPYGRLELLNSREKRTLGKGVY